MRNLKWTKTSLDQNNIWNFLSKWSGHPGTGLVQFLVVPTKDRVSSSVSIKIMLDSLDRGIEGKQWTFGGVHYGCVVWLHTVGGKKDSTLHRAYGVKLLGQLAPFDWKCL